MTTQLIVGLDLDTREQALSAVHACQGCEWFKIGSQLFTRCGPSIVKEVLGLGRHVFLDLKYHDIPNTVGSACRAAAELGVSLLTLHAAGGRKMIAAAREAVEGSETRLLAVTVLTSLSEDMLRNEVGLPESPAEAVRRYAKLAVDSGAHGIVCSPWEIDIVREAVGPDALVVTPGIRPTWASADDQARIMTPREA
ncbi:MAG: orotidine-5'-phosphate decarboxylase, partial [FCB group bacterium]|nr:orotidine-5'-phosphate decarboxylase [FCB group bacterium]